MNPQKIIRHEVKSLTDLPNIGKKMEKKLQLIGINSPSQLLGKSPYQMHNDLCDKTGTTDDPCVIDVFLSITRFIDGAEPKPWWEYTRERKRYLNKHKA